jgi:uncharacterized protein YjiS (DUF1127 family)
MADRTTEFDPHLSGQCPGTHADATGAIRTTPLHHRIFGAIVAIAVRTIAAYAQWRQRRRTTLVLSGLSDAMLKDLGLTRSDARAYESKDDIRNWRTIDRWR